MTPADEIEWSATADRWTIDGSEHDRGGRRCRCEVRTGTRDRCECGGLIHRQGVYGGYVCMCEDCGVTS